eukprot:s709_g17.t1
MSSCRLALHRALDIEIVEYSWRQNGIGLIPACIRWWSPSRSCSSEYPDCQEADSNHCRRCQWHSAKHQHPCSLVIGCCGSHCACKTIKEGEKSSL